ncbi:ATP-binding cassette domain-containing protein [Corticibacter populi]|uniref:phosphatase domain-containing putative toxin n=1 Tax=Corticibacter populi TaxID=1550736 RepID=UPI0013C2FB41|nr:ATP-binding cassette domain-containing protein [Corticibacter populi]
MSIEGLDAWYADRQVLFGADVALPERGCCVILGPSGTGKSTLLRSIRVLGQAAAGVLQVDEGDWRAACTGATRHAPLRCAAVLQKPARPAGTVLQFFCEGRAEDAATVLQQLRSLFAELDCREWLPALFDECAALAQADWICFNLLKVAALQPNLVLLDEPTAGLDEAAARRVLALVRALALRASLLMITHHLGEARVVADQVILMGNGRVIEAGPAARFFAAPQSEQARYFLAHGTLPEQSAEPAQEPAQTSDRIAMAMAALQAGRRPGHGRGHALQPNRFRWVVPDQLAGVAMPGLLADVQQDLQGLQGSGITTLLNLTETPFDAALAAQYGIECCFTPMPDMAAPSLEQAVDICALLDRKLAAGACVAVHCKAGQGRTGTVLGMYLMWRSKGQWSGEQALRAMRRIDTGWIQSEAQRIFLAQFQRFLLESVTFS